MNRLQMQAEVGVEKLRRLQVVAVVAEEWLLTLLRTLFAPLVVEAARKHIHSTQELGLTKWVFLLPVLPLHSVPCRVAHKPADSIVHIAGSIVGSNTDCKLHIAHTNTLGQPNLWRQQQFLHRSFLGRQ